MKFLKTLAILGLSLVAGEDKVLEDNVENLAEELNIYNTTEKDYFRGRDYKSFNIDEKQCSWSNTKNYDPGYWAWKAQEEAFLAGKDGDKIYDYIMARSLYTRIDAYSAFGKNGWEPPTSSSNQQEYWASWAQKRIPDQSRKSDIYDRIKAQSSDELAMLEYVWIENNNWEFTKTGSKFYADSAYQRAPRNNQKAYDVVEKTDDLLRGLTWNALRKFQFEVNNTETVWADIAKKLMDGDTTAYDKIQSFDKTKRMDEFGKFLEANGFDYYCTKRDVISKEQRLKKNKAEGTYEARKANKLTCSMDGYVKMTREIVELVMILATWAKEAYAAALPKYYRIATKYFYSFLTGMSGWIGYATVSLYFFSVEFEFDKEMCEYSSYGYELIDLLTVLVEWTESQNEIENQNNQEAEYVEEDDSATLIDEFATTDATK